MLVSVFYVMMISYWAAFLARRTMTAIVAGLLACILLLLLVPYFGAILIEMLLDEFSFGLNREVYDYVRDLADQMLSTASAKPSSEPCSFHSVSNACSAAVSSPK